MEKKELSNYEYLKLIVKSIFIMLIVIAKN